MQERLEQRLEELKAEYENGKKVLAELDAKRASVQNTMLRISGAIQVLEEEIRNMSQTPEPARSEDVTKLSIAEGDALDQ